jgi:hypothetical protein
MSEIVALPLAADVREALAQLTSLQDGDRGVVAITACGSRALPALRALLLEGAASGIYQPRCRAVEALAALGAHDVLIEFLNAPRDIADPVNRSGEDAVVNAAARALIGVADARIFPLLMRLAQTRLLAGVIEALGSCGRVEALPVLLRALSEDHTRKVAEAALLRLGPAAGAALAALATRPLPAAEGESASSRRTRLSAVGLLARLGAPCAALWRLSEDADPEIAAAACRACLATGTAEKRAVLQRLIALIPRLPLIAVIEAEECLAEHFGAVREIAAQWLEPPPPDPSDNAPAACLRRSLARAARHAGAAAERCRSR